MRIKLAGKSRFSDNLARWVVHFIQGLQMITNDSKLLQ